jgi:TolB protein
MTALSKSNRRPFRRRLALAGLLVALWALILPTRSVHADDTTIQGLHIRVNKPGGKDLPLALPRPKGNSASVDALWELLNRDMEISGYFRMLDPKGFIEPTDAGLSPGSFRFTDWDVSGTAALAKTKLDTDAQGRLVAEIWVYDVAGRKKLLGKKLRARPEELRVLGHRIANEIIQAIGGEKGIFNTRIAAVSRKSGNKEIVVFDVDGFNVQPVTRNGSINLQPAWSRDGRKLAFTSYRRGNPDLYMADLVRGKTRPVSAQPGINSGAAFHPNGGLMALTLSNRGNSDIYTVGTNGRNRKRLTHSAGIDVSPTWSPDGSQIAFASERSGGIQIYTMDLKGGSAKRLTFNGNHNTDPSWSPQGDRIAYVSRDGRFDVFTIKTDGSGRVRITEDMGNNEDPSWSPDGRYLAFSSTRTGAPHIWMSTADNTHQMQITRGRGSYTNPAWGPPLW